MVDADYQNAERNAWQKRLRNIGISAHIDSGKTTLTERVLFYSGRINKMHEVKGKDGTGAVMDYMDLEREKGITIQSAATYCSWGDHRINIIDTPGHVDFTIEVERALRVLDAAVLVMCGVSGVQSQTITVDRQMRRYNIPRIVFINKLDRAGAEPFRIVKQLRTKLNLNAHPLQIPIGLEAEIDGLVDLITMKAKRFDGEDGISVRDDEIPAYLKEDAEKHRQSLLEGLADADDDFAEKFMESNFTVADIKAAIRRATLTHRFTPVLMGTALKNKGVQLLLDAVVEYMPNPMEASNIALDPADESKKIALTSDSSLPFVGLAFKLEEGRFGQLTYMRVYQGSMSRSDTIFDVVTGRKLKVPRLVRMHADDKEEIQKIEAGDICAMFGLECTSGTTFTDGNFRAVMSSMHIPEPVMSLAISTKKKEQGAAFSKALQRFQKEDPTFRVTTDQDSGETIISGMGELHLEIYVERMKREYSVDAVIGKPLVAYRETIGSKIPFDFTHKKQTGGAGQFARIAGYLEPTDEAATHKRNNEFVNAIIGASIPPQYIPACEKGFKEATEKGPLIGMPVTDVRMVINDGAFHAVDSSELAFRACTVYAVKQAFEDGDSTILEPVMAVEILAPSEFQGTIMAGIRKRKGLIETNENSEDYTTIRADVPLNNMFGYSTDLRSQTQGKGEFSMEYKKHQELPRDEQIRLMAEYKKANTKK